MQPTSALWSASLGLSPTIVFRAEILDATGTVILSTEALPESGQQIVVDDARVVDDGTRGIRSTSTVVLVRGIDDAGTVWPLVPTTRSALLSPLSGATLQLYAGFEYPDGTQEVVPVSRHYWTNSKVEEDESGIRITLECRDLTGRLDACPMTRPYLIASGLNYLTEMKKLIAVVLPNVVVIETPTTRLTPTIILDQQANLLAELHKMASAIGYEMFMDALGRLVLRPVPDLDDEPTVTYAAGSGMGLFGVTNAFDDETTYNGVIAQGENVLDGTAPIRGEAWDLDPTSATYYDPTNPSASRLGPRPFFYVSEYLASAGQANVAAKSRLQRVKGLSQLVTATVAQNPALEVHDVIQIERPTAGVGGKFMIERRQIVAGPTVMPIACQQRKVLI